MDEIDLQRQVGEVAAFRKLVRSGLPHERIAFFFGERLDFRSSLVAFLAFILRNHDLFRIRDGQRPGMYNGIIVDMRAVDPLLRQEQRIALSIFTQGNDAGNNGIRFLAPGDSRHVLPVGDFISTVWWIVVIQEIEICVVPHQPCP